MAEIVLDLSTTEVYEAGATLVAVLAYPEERNGDEARARLHRALCALALRAKCELDEDWARSPQWIKPIYAFCGDRDIKNGLKTLERRLRDRMVAARMAIAFLKQEVDGKPPKLPKGVKRLSINQLAELVLNDAKQTDPGNVKTRTWRQSLPVIHLAAATQILMSQAEQQGQEPRHIGHLLVDRDFVQAVVRYAQEYEDLIAKSSHIKIDHRKLVKVRLA